MDFDGATDRTDLNRAHLYRLLAALLARPPEAPLLTLLAGLEGDPALPRGTGLGEALAALSRAAAGADPRGAEREYTRLFIGVQRGELVPYASYYLTGFLQDRPLVAVRQDMARLGIAREPGVCEPEDHAAALLEMMAGLADGSLGAPRGEQQGFFARHLDPWMGRLFRDLERAEGAVLYRPVGTLGRVFIEIEAGAFALADA